MRKLSPKWMALAVLILLALISAACPAAAREITDMAGRRVVVPDSITKVYGSSPPATYLLYALDPSLIAGLNFPFSAEERVYLRPGVEKIPVIGGWFGQGKTPNLEILLLVKPDIMIVWMWKESAANQKIEQTAQMMHLPVVYVKLEHLGDYPAAFDFLGRLLGREDRARQLSEYARQALTGFQSIMASIPEPKKISVYYAEGRDGLSSECDQSSHSEVINLAGGRNIYRCAPKSLYGMERISMEQIIRADPEAIVAQDKTFVDSVYQEPGWAGVKAVKDKKVYLIPRAPFNWFDRPPSFMRLLGVKWLLNLLYPQLYPVNMVDETKKFYQLFLGVGLDDAAAGKVLHR
ncbi:MAG: ABC transporter substrate-binding protein [Deltaproteobacteria bacterium]|nr:ABC transporter substrate-binding protein [Deltaproteobacteria bacterium]MBF0526899.1 ABC transporter substrate-binding protein [Deltaproteobacteria bacterium]